MWIVTCLKRAWNYASRVINHWELSITDKKGKNRLVVFVDYAKFGIKNVFLPKHIDRRKMLLTWDMFMLVLFENVLDLMMFSQKSRKVTIWKRFKKQKKTTGKYCTQRKLWSKEYDIKVPFHALNDCDCVHFQWWNIPFSLITCITCYTYQVIDLSINFNSLFLFLFYFWGGWKVECGVWLLGGEDQGRGTTRSKWFSDNYLISII